MTEQIAVEVADLAVRFRQRERTTHAVNGVSFRLARGEVLGILGEVGFRQGVTLRALIATVAGNLQGGCGIMIDGEGACGTCERLKELRGSTVAMIFQEPAIALDPVFTIGDQIIETIMRHTAVSRQQARQRALGLLERVQIPLAGRRLDSYPHEMSGGMRQRAMIALALSCNPSVLLADEPTTALDVTVQIQILLLLRELQREFGMAVIFVTHDVGAAVEVSDRLAVMYAGRFVETGTLRDVLNRHAHPYTEALLAANLHGSEPGARLITIPGSPPNLSALPQGCSFGPRCIHALDSCKRTDPPPVVCGDGHLACCLRVEERLGAVDSSVLATGK